MEGGGVLENPLDKNQPFFVSEFNIKAFSNYNFKTDLSKHFAKIFTDSKTQFKKVD